MSRFPTTLLVFFVALMLATACGLDAAREAGERAGGSGGQESPQPSDGASDGGQTTGDDPSTTTPAPEPTSMEQPEDTTGGSLEAAGRPLEDRYYQDSDGNEIPDFIEVENGEDPNVDDCALEGGCGNVAADVGGSRVTDEQNTLLILDSSGSMAERDSSGVAKITAAKDALERYVVGTPDSFNLGLMVYGHEGSNSRADRAESCRGIETFAPLGGLGVDNVRPTLARFRPTGWTPVAGSLQRAAGEFEGEEGAVNRVILVTDGIETCDGDPVAAARKLKQSNIAVTVDVVGFDVANASEQAALRRVAEATGGDFAAAQNASELNDYFDDVVARVRDLTSALACLQRQSASATGCVNFTSAYAVYDLNRALIEEPPDSERRQAIEDLKDRIEADTDAYKRQIEETTGPRIEELQRELDAANARYRKRYGNEDVSFPDPCPEPSVVLASTKLVAPDSPTLKTGG